MDQIENKINQISGRLSEYCAFVAEFGHAQRQKHESILAVIQSMNYQQTLINQEVTKL